MSDSFLHIHLIVHQLKTMYIPCEVTIWVELRRVSLLVLTRAAKVVLIILWILVYEDWIVQDGVSHVH